MDSNQLREANRVIVYVWASSSNLAHSGANVGHVSLEALGDYFSLWPQQVDEAGNAYRAKNHEGLGAVTPISPQFMESYDTDKDLEGRAAELTVCFYTLEPEAILEKFEEIKSQLTGWCLLGGFSKRGHSCASLAWSLLMASGLKRLLNTGEAAVQASQLAAKGSSVLSRGVASSQLGLSVAGSFYSSEHLLRFLITSPDMLYEALKQAKTNELTRRPETAAIAHPGEWRPGVR